MSDSPGRITQLLADVAEGRQGAREEFWALVYGELQHLARHQLAATAPNRALQPTSLVHEAYLRLTSYEGMSWLNRKHFFAAAAQAMRCIRVDDVRKRNRIKRGGGNHPGSLESEPAAIDRDSAEVLSLDEGLELLEREHPRQAEVAKLRYFVGLTVPETAEILSLSPRTVDKDWRFARAWLHRNLTESDQAQQDSEQR